MARRFTPDEAFVAADEDTGEVVILTDDAAASFARGEWWPGLTFNRAHLYSSDSGFSPVSEPVKVQRYLDAAHDALLKSLAAEETND